MNTMVPNSYYQFIEQTQKYTSYPTLKVEELITNWGIVNGLTLHAQSPVFYIVDYRQQEYLYIDPSCKKILGYEPDQIAEAGPFFLTSLWDKKDFDVFTKKILPVNLDFLRKQKPADCQDYSFSFNYRIKTKTGTYLSVLQRSTYFLVSEEGIPLAAIGFIVDISHFKQDNSIIHTIEKIDRNVSMISKTTLYKSVYYPDKITDVFSHRETEILRLIYEGCSSRKIADTLFISLHTVNNHRKNMLKKAGVKNVAELLNYAVSKKILSFVVKCAMLSEFVL